MLFHSSSEWNDGTSVQAPNISISTPSMPLLPHGPSINHCIFIYSVVLILVIPAKIIISQVKLSIFKEKFSELEL